MLKSFKTSLMAASIIACASVPSFADNHEQDVKFSVTELKPGLYMLMGVGGFTGGNIGLSVGDDGVVMIDDAMPSTLDIMQDAIKSVTDQKIDFLINTHVHGDHAGNNPVMSEQGVHIVAHKNLREHLLTKGVSMGGETKPAPKGMLPIITFDGSMAFHLNGENAHLKHLPKAHTDGDAIIHFENANVIHTGDVFFNGIFPFIDNGSGGSPYGFLAAQKAILAMANDATQIIPGHGPLATKSDLQAAADMLEDSIKIVETHLKDGKSEDEIVAAIPLKKYHDSWSWNFITTERMTRQLVQGLQETKQLTHNRSAAGHSH